MRGGGLTADNVVALDHCGDTDMSNSVILIAIHTNYAALSANKNGSATRDFCRERESYIKFSS
jgi:hypothetical protein